MWHGTTLYFLSDRDGRQRDNLWAYDTQTKQTRQVTHYTDSDVHFPSIGPDEIVFENGGRLHLLDLATEQTREVKINVVTDRATLRPRVRAMWRVSIRNATISPTGKRALFEARGEIFSVPAEHGIVRNLTESSGVAERFPGVVAGWKMDRLFHRPHRRVRTDAAPGGRQGRRRSTVTKLGPGFRYQPQWSPDSKKIVFIDNAMHIYLCDLEAKRSTVIGKQLWMYEGELRAFRGELVGGQPLLRLRAGPGQSADRRS